MQMLQEFAKDDSHPGDNKYVVLLLHYPAKNMPACTWYRVFGKSHKSAVELAIQRHQAKQGPPFWNYISAVVGTMPAMAEA
jgi:hypothetical protein